MQAHDFWRNPPDKQSPNKPQSPKIKERWLITVESERSNLEKFLESLSTSVDKKHQSEGGVNSTPNRAMNYHLGRSPNRQKFIYINKQSLEDLKYLCHKFLTYPPQKDKEIKNLNLEDLLKDLVKKMLQFMKEWEYLTISEFSKHLEENYIPYQEFLKDQKKKIAAEQYKKDTSVDVLVITALEDELQGLFCSEMGWSQRQDKSGFTYYQKSFWSKSNGLVTIAAAHAECIGRTHTAIRATELYLYLKPLCLAMTGICAGNKDQKISQGDVIVASSIFDTTSGKIIADYEEFYGIKIRQEKTFYDLITCELKPAKWKEYINDAIYHWNPPAHKPKSRQKKNSDHKGVKISPIGTVDKVQEDSELFATLKERERNILGVDMEGIAIGAVVKHYDIPAMIVIKAVQDHADLQKDHRFRRYASEASASFLITFLTRTDAIQFIRKDQRAKIENK